MKVFAVQKEKSYFEIFYNPFVSWPSPLGHFDKFLILANVGICSPKEAGQKGLYLKTNIVELQNKLVFLK